MSADADDERTVHVRLVGGIEDSRGEYVSSATMPLSGSNDDPAQIRGFIQMGVEGCIEQWYDAVETPGEITELDFTLSPDYMDILTPDDVDWLQSMAPDAETTLRYSETPTETTRA